MGSKQRIGGFDLGKTIKESKLYKDYMASKSHSFSEDKEFILELYKNFIAPEVKLHETLEADESHWADDIAIAQYIGNEDNKQFERR